MRELLIAQLDKEIAAAPVATADGYIDDIEAEAATLREAWGRMLAAAPALPTVPLFLANQLIGDRDASILLLSCSASPSSSRSAARPNGCIVA